jgi:ribosomal protein L37E
MPLRGDEQRCGQTEEAEGDSGKGAGVGCARCDAVFTPLKEVACAAVGFTKQARDEWHVEAVERERIEQRHHGRRPRQAQLADERECLAVYDQYGARRDPASLVTIASWSRTQMSLEEHEKSCFSYIMYQVS